MVALHNIILRPCILLFQLIGQMNGVILTLGKQNNFLFGKVEIFHARIFAFLAHQKQIAKQFGEGITRFGLSGKSISH